MGKLELCNDEKMNSNIYIRLQLQNSFYTQT